MRYQRGLQANILDNVQGDTGDVGMSLGAFSEALDRAKSTRVMSGAVSCIQEIKAVIVATYKHASNVEEKTIAGLANHCEQLRLRAASLDGGTVARKRWPLMADFAEKFHYAGSHGVSLKKKKQTSL